MDRPGRPASRLVRAAAALLVSAAVPAWAALPPVPAPGDATSTDRAFALFGRQDYRTARIELLKALKARPNDPVARLLNARVALESGAGVAAQVEIEKARKAGAPIEKTRHLMAHAFALQDKGEEAMKEASAAIVPEPFAAYAARVRGRANMAMLRREAAGPEFETAARLAPGDIPILVDLARYRILAGDRAGAERTVDQALAINPNSGAPSILKGDLVRSRLGLTKALPYYNTAIRLDPDDVEALLERAATFGDLRREKEARADLAQVLRLRPEQPLALYLLATLEARAGRYQQAQGLMERTKQLLSDYLPATMLQGVIAFQLGNPAVADERLSRVVAAAPGYPLARRFLAAARMRAGNASGAIDALRPLADAPSASAPVLTEIGEAYRKAGRFDEAKAAFARALKAAPGSGGLRAQLALTESMAGNSDAALANLRAAGGAATPQSLATMAMIAQHGGDSRSALQAAEKLVAAKPDSPLSYDLRGSARLSLRDVRGAEADFRAALQRDPKFAEARRHLGQLLLDTGRLQAAQGELQTLVGQQPNDARALLLLSAVAAQKGNSAERLQWANRAAVADPNALATRFALAQAHLAAGQADNAVTSARAIERDFPKLVIAQKTVGLAYLAGKKGAEAEAAFRRAAQLAPQDVESVRLIAQAQVMQGRLDLARQTYADATKRTGPAVLPVYVDAVRLAQASNRAAEAQALIARLRVAVPSSNMADVLTGDGLSRAGQRPQAIAAYRAAQAKRFDRLAATRLATAYRESGQPQAAATTLLAYLKARPGDPVAASALGEIQIALGQFKTAAATYEGVLARGAADTPSALNNLAWAYQQLGDKRALATAQRALAAAPNSPDAKDTLGFTLLQGGGDKVRAQTLIEAAVKARPADPELRYHLALARVANNNPAKALAELDTALRTSRFPSRAAAVALAAKLRR